MTMEVTRIERESAEPISSQDESLVRTMIALHDYGTREGATAKKACEAIRSAKLKDYLDKRYA